MNIYKLAFYGSVIDGKLLLPDQDKLDLWLSTISGNVKVTYEKTKKIRSLNQNSAYWAIVIPILSEHFGYSAQETHEALKWKFLRKENGNFPTVQSTTELTTKEFNDYVAQVKLWANEEYQLNIPEPNSTIQPL